MQGQLDCIAEELPGGRQKKIVNENKSSFAIFIFPPKTQPLVVKTSKNHVIVLELIVLLNVVISVIHMTELRQ